MFLISYKGFLNIFDMDLSEKRFEQDIESYFLSHGVRRILPQEYDRENMIFPNVLEEFVSASQPKAWEKYKKLYGENAVSKLIHRLNTAISNSNVLDVLKKGVKDMGIEIALCYFKPSSNINQELVKLYNANIVGVTRQFPYSSKNSNTIDMVLSVNGIPLFAFELKNQFKGQDVTNAIHQWESDRDQREPVFRFGARFLACFAVDLFEAFVTTRLEGDKTRFLPFNQGSNGAGKSGGKGNPANSAGYQTSYIWEKVFSRDSLFDLVKKFIAIVEEKTVRKDKACIEKKIIFPRFHQYDVVNKIIDDVEQNGAGRNYLIQHSAGSGKSNSIAWLTYALACSFDNDDKYIFDSVIVVTNRIVLDTQLQDTINTFEHKAGLVECITQKSGSRGLKDAINDKKKIIICTIQKFLYAYKDFDRIRNRNFAIIIDEAHQGQSGESARVLRSSLIDIGREKAQFAADNDMNAEAIDETQELIAILGQGRHANQSFFAFTATPTSKTVELFGTEIAPHVKGPFHIYSMRQAIEEGFILNVLSNYCTIKEAFRLKNESNERIELSEEKAKKALVRYYKSHEYTISMKVDIIMENFLENCKNKINGRGKAMVVTDSRQSAVLYYKAIGKYISEKNLQGSCGVLVAFSGKVKLKNDDREYTEAELNQYPDGEKINTDSKFRNAFKSDHFNIMVVADKYQTGFDEPLLHSMYVDKKLKGVAAVQTLSRLNRVAQYKNDTFVLDFANDKDSIRESFQPFYEEVELQGESDVNRVYDLKAKLDSLALYTSDDVDGFYFIVNSNSNGRNQSEAAIGKLANSLKEVIGRYAGLQDEKRLEARDTMMKFVRMYGFVTQLVRLYDDELLKEYLFVSQLIRLLPKAKNSIPDLTDKISLEYAKLKETFKGAIELNAETAVISPSKASKAPLVSKKTNTLERIIEKINERFQDDFSPEDRVAVGNVCQMLVNDPDISRKLSGYAKTNNIQMFANSLFPKIFQDVLVKCYTQNDSAFQKLLGNDGFQKLVMGVIAKELYEKFTTERAN